LLPESVNLDEARTLILERLHRERRYAAVVEASTSDGEEGTVYEFTVDEGPRYAVRSFEVEGNEALSTEEIRRAVSGFARAEYKGLWNLAYDRRGAVSAIERAYREIGHAEAKIGAPRIVSDPAARSIDIRLSVAEGPRRTVRAILFSGNSALADAELRKIVRIAEGGPYDPAVVAGDEGSLQALYRSKGHQQAEVRAEARPPAGEPDVDIVFEISEGPTGIVSGVEVTGARRTREGLIRKAVKIKEGDVFSFEALARGQKRLYDLGVFRTVNISRPDSSREDSQVPVVVEVSEEPPLTLTYAVRYNSEDKLEGQLEAALVNILGGGRTGYLSYRQGAKLRDARFSVQVPYILGLRADTRFSLSASQERREAYVGEELAASVGQDADILRGFELSAFYKLSRVRERAPDADAFGPASILSELSLNLIRDKRDDRFDPGRGSFLSFSVTGAPKVLGSERPYVRGFAQYSFYRPVGRRGAIWASSVRFGASSFRDEPLSSRLFYAGGGTSIRGFAQDRVGPIDALTGLPTGGRFVLIVNEELRVPLFWIFRGIVFYDTGNVYSSLGDLGRLGLRHGLGIGLRAESPIGLIRLDCGLNPFRRAGEPSVVFFLSLGQAF
jgi:outer membrane protein assembly complex protein YaeT